MDPDEQRGEQPLTRRHLVGVVGAVWAVAVAVVLLVATDTKAGPVVLTLSPRHGIHVGDLLALVVCSAVALGVTAAVVRRSRRAGRAG